VSPRRSTATKTASRSSSSSARSVRATAQQSPTAIAAQFVAEADALVRQSAADRAAWAATSRVVFTAPAATPTPAAGSVRTAVAAAPSRAAGAVRAAPAPAAPAATSTAAGAPGASSSSYVAAAAAAVAAAAAAPSGSQRRGGPRIAAAPVSVKPVPPPANKAGKHARKTIQELQQQARRQGQKARPKRG
jgi:hypothetical protein